MAPAVGDTLEQGPHRLVALSVAPGPSVFRVDDFLTVAECEHVMAAAEAHLESSLIVTVAISPISPIRADGACQTRLPHELDRVDMGADPVLSAIQSRVAAICGLRHSELKPLAEDLQVVHYNVGQHFGAHHDSGFGNEKRDPTLLVGDHAHGSRLAAPPQPMN